MPTIRTTPTKPTAFYGPLSTKAIGAVFDTLAAAMADPKTELEYGTPFQLLAAVALSAHTTDRSVNAATRTLFPVAGTPQAMVALGVDKLRAHIKGVGLYNGKATRLIALCKQLIELHGGEVPNDRAALEALPGVGRKTANVVLNIVFGEHTVAVDTHVQRVANRLGIARTTRPEQTEQVLLARTPARHLHHAHHYLILHGRYTCVARVPKCPACPVRKLCKYPDKTVEKSGSPEVRKPKSR